MAFVRLLQILVKDPNIGERIVPIVPDEARTFGMEGMFRQLGIYSSVGQLYEPVDTGQMMVYREDRMASRKRGLMKAAPFLHGSRPQPLTQPMHKRWFLSIFITRCLGFNEWGSLLGGWGLERKRVSVRRHVGSHNSERGRAPTSRWP